MSERSTHFRLRAFLVANWANLTILAVCLLFLRESLTLRGDAGRYPLVVAVITSALVLLDMAGHAMRSAAGAARGGDTPDLKRRLLAGRWVALTLALFYAIGVIAAIAVAATLYFYLFVFRRPLPALLTGLAHAGAFWLAFDVLAGFRLHPGIF